MLFRSRFGNIKKDYLKINNSKDRLILINKISEIKISENELSRKVLFLTFEKTYYNFIITIENEESVQFKFQQKNLPKAIEFRNRILHAKFSIS